MMKDSTVLVRMRATGENNKDLEFFCSSLSLTSYIENPRQTAGDTIAYVARESRVSDIQPKLILYTACIVIRRSRHCKFGIYFLYMCKLGEVKVI